MKPKAESLFFQRKQILENKSLIYLASSILMNFALITHGENLMSTNSYKYKNLALGKKYTFSSPPNMRGCRDANDQYDLTDGKDQSLSTMWTEKSAVGWSRQSQRYVMITVDLEKVEPIAGASFSTAGGHGGISWPMMIEVQTSIDGKKYYLAGELVSGTKEDIPDPRFTSKYKTFIFRATNFQSKGRYVRFVVVCNGRETLCNELEIYRGNDSFLKAEPSKLVECSHAEDFFSERFYKYWKVDKVGKYLSPQRMTASGIKNRLRFDLQILKRKLSSNPELKLKAQKLFDKIMQSDFEEGSAGFKAIVPFNKLHKDILRLRAGYLHSKGIKDIVFWKSERYDPFSYFDPIKKKISNLEVKMLRNEIRSESFNITNPTNSQQTISFKISNNISKAVKAYEVKYIDTREGIVTASCLVPLNFFNGKYSLNVPAGMNIQVWLSINSKKIDAGDYLGTIGLSLESGRTEDIPLKILVANHSIPDIATLKTTMFSYLYDSWSIARNVTHKMRKTANSDMVAHLINSPITYIAPSWPQKKDIDENGNLKNTISFNDFDEFVKNWPKAKHYRIFLAAQKRLFISKYDWQSSEFAKLLSQWVIMWAKHNQKLGICPGKLSVHLVDEPHNQKELDIIAKYAEIFKNSSKDILIECNFSLRTDMKGHPIFEKFSKYIDIWWPKLYCYTNFRSDKKGYWDIFEKFKNTENKELWFYDCFGPARIFDPTHYRLQPWYCFEAGAKGSAYWAYGDGGGTQSFNEFTAIRANAYTPLYISENSILGSKHWDAVREGIQDYEYLIILKKLIDEAESKGKDMSLYKRKMSRIVGEAHNKLNQFLVKRYMREWVDGSSKVIDTQRIKILNMIESLSELQRSNTK